MKFTVGTEARELHAQSLVVDMHIDTLLIHKLSWYDMTKRHRNLFPGSPFAWQADLPRLIEGGVDVAGFGLVLNPLTVQPEKRVAKILQQLTYFKDVARNHPEMLYLADSPEKIVVNKGKVGGVPGIEGAHALAGRLEWLEMYYQMGVRYQTLAHFSSNAACNPAQGYGFWRGEGLSRFGREVVQECNRLGMILDLAHINKKGFLEAAGLSRHPFIVSHTGFKSMTKSNRNIDDEQLKVVADSGSVAGLIYAPYWTGGKWGADAEALADCLVYVMDEFGPDHVGLGSDIDGFLWCLNWGIRDVSDTPVITELLLRRGKSPEDIKKVLGGNFLRVFGEVASAAES